eukprot:76611_1
MSTILTEAERSVAASEVEPSAPSGVNYDYSESINDNDEKLDEGLRAPIPIHDETLQDTSLLSDNELEAFVKTKQYAGKGSSISPNLNSIFERLSGYSKWSSNIYEQLQTKPPKPKQSVSFVQTEEAFIHNIISETSSPILVQPEQSPFPSITPAQSQANMAMENIDSDTEDRYKPRKATLPFSMLPQSPSLGIGLTSKTQEEDKEEEKESERQAVAECTVKELMQMVGQLTSEVIHLQQNLYIKDIMMKNMYLRLREFHHISFPQLMIERIHIVANYNNKHKFSRNNKHKKKRMTLSEDSVSHGGTAMKHNTNSSYTFSSTIKHHSSVTLEVITRWMPRYNLPTAVKKGHVFLKEDDLDDIDDYLSHQMWSEWQDRCKMKYSMNGLDKMKREDVHKQLANYMQHERVGLVRIEVFRGKKYKKYKRIEKKFESLIITIADIPKGDTYHVMIKVHNPSASIWGPLSNMVSVKVPLKFIEDDEEDTVTQVQKKNTGSGPRISNAQKANK